jgi:hypothetical protein
MHNAEFLDTYPNLPSWISRSGVYFTWVGITAVGAVGYALFKTDREVSSLVILGLYACLGFDGLLHYQRAPFASHTTAMNLTILFEVAAAAMLLLAVFWRGIRHFRAPAVSMRDAQQAAAGDERNARTWAAALERMNGRHDDQLRRTRWRGMRIGLAGFTIASIGFFVGFVFELRGAFLVVVVGVLVGLIGTILHFVELYREARLKVTSFYRRVREPWEE